MTHSVLVLNHFAVPRGRPGGTRHVELFDRLDGWSHLIIASELNHLTGELQPGEVGFRPVRVTKYKANGLRRILNWISYSASAFLVGVRQPKIDVVYASSPHLLAGLTGWLISLIRRKPFVLEIRDLWPKVLVDMGELSEQSPVYRLLIVLETFLYKRADAIVVMAVGSCTELVSRGIDSNKITYIPNGADPSDFEPSETREKLRAELEFTKFTAIYTGAHGPANGLDLLLDAALELSDLPVEIVLVGGGVSKTSLVARANDLGLANIRFLDPVAKEKIPDLLSAADLGLHVLADVELFRSAVSPNKVFDYMAAALPILTNCPGVVANTVTDADAGWAVQPTELSSGIRRALLAGEEGSLLTAGDSGRDWLVSNQSRTAMAARLDQILQSVLRK